MEVRQGRATWVVWCCTVGLAAVLASTSTVRATTYPADNYSVHRRLQSVIDAGRADPSRLAIANAMQDEVLDVRVEHRGVVLVGTARLPIEIHLSPMVCGETWVDTPKYHRLVRNVRIEVDGMPCQWTARSATMQKWRWAPVRSEAGELNGDDRLAVALPKDLAIGFHLVSVTGEAVLDMPERQQVSRAIVVKGTFQVAPADALVFFDNEWEAMRPKIEAALKATSRELSENWDGLWFWQERMPVDVAFEVYLRRNGKERFLGYTWAAAGEMLSTEYGVGTFENTGVGSQPTEGSGPCEYVFRSSKKAAMCSVNLRKWWRGEIVIRSSELPKRD